MSREPGLRAQPPATGPEHAGHLPTFLVIGAPKAGTTALYRYLAEHPEIGVSSPKEIRYFGNGDGKTWRRARNLEEYRRFFQPGDGEKAWGEASPQYLHWSADAAADIGETLPDVKLIVVLRDPSERAYSQYTLFHRSSIADLERVGIEETRAGWAYDVGTPEGFSKAIRDLPRPVPVDGPFTDELRRLGLRESFYAHDLETYLRHFEREQLRIHLYEDLTADPVGTMQGIYGFLDVDPTFVPDAGRQYNVTRVAKSRRLDALLYENQRVDRFTGMLPRPLGKRVDRRLRKLTTSAERRPLTPADREVLIEIFRDDICRTGELLERDLSAWLR